MSDILWGDPPKSQSSPRGYGRHAEIAAQLRSRPGQWAKVATAAAAYMASDIKNGRYKAYQPAGSFEAVSRNTRHVDGRPTAVADIYARYIGEASDE